MRAETINSHIIFGRKVSSQTEQAESLHGAFFELS